MEDEGARVFICYRRATSWPLARLVHDDLVRRGFEVFIDVEDIDSGKFERVILREIESRAHVVVVLEAKALPLGEPDQDWMSREIRHAIRADRNIVPVIAGGLQFDDLRLPIALASLAHYNELRVLSEYFDAAMERLCSRFLRSPGTGARRGFEEIGAACPSVVEVAAAGRRTGALVSADVGSTYRPLLLTPRARRNGGLSVSGTIDDPLAGDICARLLRLGGQADVDITLYLSSPGGSVSASMRIYEMMTRITPDVRTIAVGPVAGTASLLLAAGTRGKRLARRSAHVHVGEPIHGADATERDPVAGAQSLEWLRRHLAALYAAHTGRSAVEIEAAMAVGAWFSATQAFTAGFVDGVER